MRRREDPGPGVPEPLLRFMGAEWPAWDLAEAFDMWKTARFAYVQQYPGSELGDVLDVMKGHVDEQRRQARAGEAVRP